MSKIVRCKCKHEGQDSIHGKGNRVANETAKGSAGKLVVRCTVCLAEHTVGKSSDE